MKYYYAGANTYNGFCGFFEELYPKTDWNHAYLIKGGSGVGKSTALKKIASFFESQGNEVECILCASDPNSFDGVLVPERKLIFLDATAPHALEATMPMVLEELVDFAQFLDLKGLKKYKKHLIKQIAEKKQAYAQCYAYLKAAQPLQSYADSLHLAHANHVLIQEQAEKLCATCLTPQKKKATHSRRLFAEAFCAEGFVSQQKTMFPDATVYQIKHMPPVIGHLFLECIAQQATRLGYDCEQYATPLNPNLLQSVYLSEQKITFTTQPTPNATAIQTKSWLYKTHKPLKPTLDVLQQTHTTLLAHAQLCLQEAYASHLRIEELYAKHMDFSALDEFLPNLLAPYTKGGAL